MYFFTYNLKYESLPLGGNDLNFFYKNLLFKRTFLFHLSNKEASHFFPIPLTSTTFWRVLMVFSRTGSTDCMIPSLLSISLIYGCMPSMAFIFLATSTSGCPSSSLLRILAVRAFWMFLMAAVLATAASPSPLASDERADERVDSRLTRRSSSFMWSNWLAAATATRSENFPM